MKRTTTTTCAHCAKAIQRNNAIKELLLGTWWYFCSTRCRKQWNSQTELEFITVKPRRKK